jgi:hypothetical protein
VLDAGAARESSDVFGVHADAAGELRRVETLTRVA